MTTIIIGLLIVVLGTVAYIALRNAQDFSEPGPAGQCQIKDLRAYK